MAFAVVLMKPEFDQWKPGEHNGTFRGNNFAFVTAKAAIDHYWSDQRFADEIKRKGDYVAERLTKIVDQYGEGNFTTRGRGMFRGINCINGELAGAITHTAFKKGLIIETSGAEDHVVKFLCPLVIGDENLKQGIDIVEESVAEVCAKASSIPEEIDYFDENHSVNDS